MPLPANLVEAYPSTGADAPVLKYTQNTPASVSVTLRDANGDAWAIPADHTVHMIAVETMAATSAKLDIAGTITDAASGQVSFPVTAADVTTPGIWLGQLYVKNAANELVQTFPCYVEVSPTLTEAQSWMPLTIAEVRLAIRDRVPEDNFLLDAVEFSDAEIIACLRRPIDWWNETVPEGITTYSYTTFPYRYHWLDAVVGELLRLISFNLKRNQLAVQGKGISMDDKAKADFYVQRGEQLLQSWREWAFGKIRQENLKGWYGRQANGWFGN